MKKSFILYNDQIEVIKALTNEQAGQLLKAFFDFQNGKKIQLDSVLNLVFIPFKQQFTRDLEKYQRIVEKNRENVNKRWKKEKKMRLKNDTIVYGGISGIRPDTKNTDNDNDNDNDNASKPGDALLSSKEKIWNLYAPTYLQEKSVSDNEWIERCRQNFVDKCLHPSKKAVLAFISKQQEFDTPEEYFDFATQWPNGGTTNE